MQVKLTDVALRELKTYDSDLRRRVREALSDLPAGADHDRVLRIADLPLEVAEVRVHELTDDQRALYTKQGDDLVVLQIVSRGEADQYPLVKSFGTASASVPTVVGAEIKHQAFLR